MQKNLLHIWLKDYIKMNKTYKKDTKVGKKGGKKAEPQETDRMTEVEKDLYKIQINDLLQKVERQV